MPSHYAGHELYWHRHMLPCFWILTKGHKSDAFSLPTIGAFAQGENDH